MAYKRKRDELNARLTALDETRRMWSTLWDSVHASIRQLLPKDWHRNWRPRIDIATATKDPSLHPHYRDFWEEFCRLDKKITWILHTCMDMRCEYWGLFQRRLDAKRRQKILRRCGIRFRRWINTISEARRVWNKIRHRCPQHFNVLAEPSGDELPKPCEDFKKWFTFGVTPKPLDLIWFPLEFH